MKKFAFSIFTIAMVFVGLGSMIDGVSARFKSDEKALEIIRAARIAIGGDSKLREIRGLVITGKTTMSHRIGDAEKSSINDTEIALQFPDKMMKSIKMDDANGSAIRSQGITKEVTIVTKDDKAFTVTGKDGDFTTSDGQVFKVTKDKNSEFTTTDGNKVIVRTEAGAKVSGPDGETKIFVRKPDDGGQWKTKDGNVYDVRMHKAGATLHDGIRQNELLRTTLGILLTAPEGMDVSYTFVGEGDVDGTAVNIVNAEFAGANYKLYIAKSSNLPVAMSYTGHSMPEIVKFDHKVDAPADGTKDVLVFKRHDGMSPEKVQADGVKDIVMFKRDDGSFTGAESLVKFSDYRDTGGIQLPYRWTTTSGGKSAEVFDVTSYDINPANIAEKFAGQEVKVRMKKDGN